ncbi:unnamed protein product [Auanema sp. JU1783]|nr:unnamed protein product [Auanema sp. JU1783]
MTYDLENRSQQLPEEDMGPTTKMPVSRTDSIDSISGVSNDSCKDANSSLFYDVLQAQLALWTCIFSILYSYAWGQHRKKFLISIFFVIPTVFMICCGISTLLTTIVVLGRLFSAPVTYKDFLKVDERRGPDGKLYRQRSYSGASSDVYVEDYLPKPLCRRHSSSHGSLCSRPPSVNRKLSYCLPHTNAPDDD